MMHLPFRTALILAALPISLWGQQKQIIRAAQSKAPNPPRTPAEAIEKMSGSEGFSVPAEKN